MIAEVHRVGLIASAIVIVLLAAACSDGDAVNASAPDTVHAQPSSATVCASQAAGRTVSLPAGWPSAFPLPAGLMVLTAQNRGSGGLVITGVTPTAFSVVLAGLQKDLPTAGFTPKDGETEPHDAESDWTSSTYQGRWAIRELTECQGDTAVSLLARKI